MTRSPMWRARRGSPADALRSRATAAWRAAPTCWRCCAPAPLASIFILLSFTRAGLLPAGSTASLLPVSRRPAQILSPSLLNVERNHEPAHRHPCNRIAMAILRWDSDERRANHADNLDRAGDR